MTEGIVLGKKFFIFKNGTAYGCQTDATITVNANLEELVCKDGKNKAVSDIAIDGSVAGLFAFDHTLSAIDAIEDLVAGDAVVIRMATEDGGDSYIEFNAFLTSVTITAPTQGATTYDISFVDSDGELISPAA